MGPGGPLSDPDDRGRPPAGAPVARGLQRPALARAHRRAVALDAARPAAVVHGVPADAALVAGRRVRGYRAGPARGAAPGRGARGGALGGDLRRADAAVEPGERRT